MAINGNNLFIAQGSSSTTPIAGTRSNEIQVDGELIEISSPTQGQWREYVAGRKEWNVGVSWLVLAYNDVTKLLGVGSAFTLTFRDRTNVYLTGRAILTNCKITASRGALVQGSFQFKGISALSVPT